MGSSVDSTQIKNESVNLRLGQQKVKKIKGLNKTEQTTKDLWAISNNLYIYFNSRRRRDREWGWRNIERDNGSKLFKINEK